MVNERVTVPLSFWILLFSIFLFLSLAFAKRYAELEALRRRGATSGHWTGSRSDGPARSAKPGLCVGLSERAGIGPLHEFTGYRGSVCPSTSHLDAGGLLLFWISRVWMKAQRGTLQDDPVVFALKDGASIGVGCIAVLIAILAL